MKQPDLLDRYITALRHDPTTPPPPCLDPATARAIRAMLLDDSPAIPPVGARVRIWQRILTNVQTDQSNRDASCDPRPGSWYVHSNGKQKENKAMQTVISRPILQTRAPTRTQRTRFIRLAAAVIAVVAVAAILLPGLLNDTSPINPAAVFISPQAANQAIFERYINEAWNAGNTDVLNDILTADHVCHEPGMQDVEGIDGIAATIVNYHTAFPDWQFTIESITATDDAVWARMIATGTHIGPFTRSGDVVLGPSQNTITVEVIINARFMDGKIAEQWIHMDSMALMVQIGVAKPLDVILTEARNREAVLYTRTFWARLTEVPVDDVMSTHADSYLWHAPFIASDDPNELSHISLTQATDYYNQDNPKFYHQDYNPMVKEVLVTGDWVAIHHRTEGTQYKPVTTFAGNTIEPSGEAEVWEGIDLYRLEDGRIVEVWEYVDRPRWARATLCDTTPESSQAITEAQNTDVARRAVEAIGSPGTPFNADEYYHSDASWGEGTVGPIPHTTDQRNDWVNNELWIAFPDFQVTIDRITADGDLVIVEGTTRGRFEEDLLWVNNRRVPATGKVDRWSWVWVFRFEDGKIAAEQWYWDWRSLYED